MIDHSFSSGQELLTLCETEQIPISEAAVQYVMLAFRTTRGVSKDEYFSRFGENFDDIYIDKMQRFLDKKLMLVTGDGYRLSRRGMLVSNMILSEILDFDKK